MLFFVSISSCCASCCNTNTLLPAESVCWVAGADRLACVRMHLPKARPSIDQPTTCICRRNTYIQNNPRPHCNTHRQVLAKRRASAAHRHNTNPPTFVITTRPISKERQRALLYASGTFDRTITGKPGLISNTIGRAEEEAQTLEDNTFTHTLQDGLSIMCWRRVTHS